MIYFFNNDLQLQKVVVSANLLLAQHEHELNNLIRADVAVDLSYAKSFINDVDHFGYYYKDVFYLHKIQSVEDDHANELLIISGRHIFFDDMLFGPLIRDVRPQNQEAGFMLRQTIEANTRWNIVMTDVTGRLSTNFYWVPPFEALEWIVENFRLEYLPVILFDGQNINGYQLHVKKRIGEQKHIRIPWGERVEQLTHEIDYSEIITKLSVRGKGEEVGDGYGRRINISGINFSRNGVVSPSGSRYLEDPNITATYGNDGQTPREGDVTFEDIEVVSELVEAGYQHYLDVSRPQVLISADVAQIGDVAIGDGVLIIRREHEMYFEARVHKLSVDLLNQEDAQIELGDYDHFKETKVERRTRQNNERVERELSSRIQQLKLDFDYRFDGEVAQMREDFEQALIDAHAEIQAAEQRMETLIESERDTMMDEFNENVQEARNYAEQQAQEHSDRVQSNLESFEQTHQQLYDSVTSDIMDIDTFLGDKSQTLAQQFADVESNFSGLQSELSGVSADLGATKTELQEQLDEAREELEGIEVGGRNYLAAISDSTSSNPHRDTIVEDGIIYWTQKTTGTSPFSIDSYAPEGRGDYVFSFKTNNSENLRGFVNSREGGTRHTTPVIKEQNGYFHVSLVLTNYITHSSINFYGVENFDPPKEVLFWDLKLEKGTIATDWTPAPEDTERKITTLNEQIEYIDGQLSAKLEQTDIEPINNKITEYGNTLTANAQSIQSLLDKTELHGGDITQWSNETKANAESISQTLTRVEETEAGISQAQTDIQTNADGIAGMIRDVETIDGELSTLTTDFNIEAGKIETLISKTDGHDTQLTNIVADYNSIEQTVAANDEWLGTHGSNVLQTVDGFEQKVWLNDVAKIGANLLPMSSNAWEGGTFWSGGSNNNNSGGIRTKDYIDVIPGERYTFQDDSAYVSAILEVQIVQWDGDTRIGITDFVNRGSSRSFTAQGDRIRIGLTPMSGFGVAPRFVDHLDERIQMKLEKGNTATPLMNSLSHLEQTTSRIALRVQELSSVDGESILTQSDITIESDNITIGSTLIGSSTLASIISVSPSAIDMITDELNLTGNLNVSGQIEAISLDAIDANFARVQTAVLKSNVIKSAHVDSNVITSDHIRVNQALVDKLVASTIFTDEISTLSLNAVYGNISDLRTELLTSNVILSRHVNASMALIDKIFSEEAYIERLTSKSAFIRDIQAIEISANQLNLTTLKNRINQIEGGLRIVRPDGAVWVENGQARGHVPVQVSDGYAGANIRFNGTNFITGSSNYQTMKYFYTPHEGTRLRVVFAVGLFGGPSSVEFMHVRVRGFSGYNPINMGLGSSSQRVRVISGETNYVTLDIPMAPPNYAEMAAYLEFRRDPDGQHSDNEVYARLLHIGQYE